MFISPVCDRPDKSRFGQIEISIARSQDELEEAFRMVYDAYVRAGLEQPNAAGVRLTPYHLLPTTDVIIAKHEGLAIATASVILDSELGLPADSIYTTQLQTLRDQGLRLAEVGCLADRRESPVRFIQMFRRLTRLIAQAAADRGCDGLIIATHPKHARFYMRQLGFEQIGELRSCPYAQGNPAVALWLEFAQIRLRDEAFHQHLFAHPIAPEQLEPYLWEESTRAHFIALLQDLPGFYSFVAGHEVAPTALASALNPLPTHRQMAQ